MLFSIAAPALTMQAAAPEEGEFVIDISEISEEQLENSTIEELQSTLLKAPHKEIESSSESFAYAFTHPQIIYFYLEAVAFIFPFIFLAAVISSFLNTRKSKKTSAHTSGSEQA
jgi:hypothetical protein